MHVNEKVVGILLAGGLSRRYGSPKAFAEIHGKKFYEIVYETLQSVCDHVIIVTREEFIERFSRKYHIITDVEKYAGCGPLAGIYSAMVTEQADHYVVLPCDMPLITPEVMKQLINFHTKDITLVETEGFLQPLVSIWRREVQPTICQSLEKGQLKMKDVLDKREIVKVKGTLLSNSPKTFMNVNTPEEDKEMRKWKQS